MAIMVDDNGKFYFEKNTLKKAQEIKDFSELVYLRQSPRDDIRILLIRMLAPSDGMCRFPKNWGYENIINRLLIMLNSNEYQLEKLFEQELLPLCEKYGSHKSDDFNEPYIKEQEG